MSALAPTSLAEERARGSLDVLMTTPLSTWSIVWGKWLGTYRIVLWLAVLPCLASVIVACLAPSFPARFTVTFGVVPLVLLDRIMTPCVVVAQMLSYGAAITSMGLALATWVPRLGRAIAINVIIFVLITIGWPLFLQSFIVQPLQASLPTNGTARLMDYRWFIEGMMAISPFMAPILTLQQVVEYAGNDRWKFWLVAVTWCMLAAGFAAAVLWAALKSFDHCLGRMSETSVSEWESIMEQP
jgi:ABC-type transport system involved in multi-copper enzyme maturation permease subunit